MSTVQRTIVYGVIGIVVGLIAFAVDQVIWAGGYVVLGLAGGVAFGLQSGFVAEHTHGFRTPASPQLTHPPKLTATPVDLMEEEDK